MKHLFPRSAEGKCPAFGLIWSMDGRKLLYRDRVRKQIVEHTFEEHNAPTTEERGKQ
jgi:hypothetical protein